MLHFIGQALTSFIASAAFGIIFNAPRRMLLHGGFVGMIGWIIYIVLEYAADAVPATLAATIAVGVISQLFSRMFRAPVIILAWLVSFLSCRVGLRIMRCAVLYKIITVPPWRWPPKR